MFRFHAVCGSRVKLSNGNRTAERLKANIDFNNGVVFSDKKLKTGVIFQVRIDKKVRNCVTFMQCLRNFLYALQILMILLVCVLGRLMVRRNRVWGNYIPSGPFY